MRILIIGESKRNIYEVSNYSGLWMFYLIQQLERNGVELRFVPRAPKGNDELAYFKAVDLSDIDHILAVNNRYFTRINRAVGPLLMSKCRGAVTQLYENCLACSEVHCTFAIAGDSKHRKGNCHGIGWSADPALCYPQQSDSELRILIDHSMFHTRRPDLTKNVVGYVKKLVDSDVWKSKYQSIRVRRMVGGAVVDCDFGQKTFPLHNRKGVPYPEICQEYSQAHIFMMTHPESLGMSVIETGTAGALVLTQEGWVLPHMLATVRHVIYKGRPDWDKVLAAIDPTASHAKGSECKWDDVGDRVYSYFANFRRK